RRRGGNLPPGDALYRRAVLHRNPPVARRRRDVSRLRSRRVPGNRARIPSQKRRRRRRLYNHRAGTQARPSRSRLMSRKKFSIHNTLPPELKNGTPLAFGADDRGDIAFGFVAGEEPDEQDLLMDCAVEWLPALPQVTALIDGGIRLDYGVLVSARIA